MTRALLGGHVLASEGETAIGKFVDGTDIRVAHASVAPRHAVIRGHAGVYTLHDTGSTNGTRVNGVPVRVHVLAEGDVIACGEVTLRFELQDR